WGKGPAIILKLPAADQRQQAEDVAAAAVVDEAGAVAGAVLRRADADVVERAEAEAVNGEAAAADVAGGLGDRVEGRGPADADAEDADAVGGRRPHQADRAGGGLALGHTGSSRRAGARGSTQYTVPGTQSGVQFRRTEYRVLGTGYFFSSAPPGCPGPAPT